MIKINSVLVIFHDTELALAGVYKCQILYRQSLKKKITEV